MEIVTNSLHLRIFHLLDLSKSKYRNYAIHSRTMFFSFSLFDATIFQEQLSFKGNYLLKNPFSKPNLHL